MPCRGRARVRALAATLGAIIVLGLAACGDSGGETTSTKAPAPTVATGPESGATGGEVAALRDRLNAALLRLLTEREGLSRSRAECAIDKFEGSIGDEDLRAAIREAAAGSGVPQDILDAAFDAGQACAEE